MERVARLFNLQRYLRWTGRQGPADEDEDEGLVVLGHEDDDDDGRRPDGACRLMHVLESILLWENSVNSISVVVVFNILFWVIVILEVRGFVAASSAALVVVLCYSTLEAQIPKEKESGTNISQAKTEHFEKIAKKTKSTLESLKQMRRDQPGAFCSVVCTVSIGLWLLGRTINGVLLAYTIFMSILLGPILLLQMSTRTLSSKEWDSEIEEFLPAVTEDNLQVLKQAGDSRDHSPTPPSVDSDSPHDSINDDDLVGLRMPSHEEGSVDGLELSELELSTGDMDSDGIKFQTGHFERGSSSEEEAELEPDSKNMSSHSEDSDSEFEIIDSREVAGLKNV